MLLFSTMSWQLSTVRSIYAAGSEMLKGLCYATVPPAKLAG
jgi:hypothetical protein